MAYVPLSERRAIRASKSDVPLPDYTKEPRPIFIVWDANNDFTEHEISRLWSLFKNKHLDGLTGQQRLMDTREVLMALLAYRNIPIKLLQKNIPLHLQPVVDNTMSNLVGVVYWSPSKYLGVMHTAQPIVFSGPEVGLVTLYNWSDFKMSHFKNGVKCGVYCLKAISLAYNKISML